MIDIKVDIDTDAVKRLKLIAQSNGAPQAVANALNRAIDKGYSVTNKEITREYAISLKDVKSLSHVKHARREKLEAYLQYGGGTGDHSPGRMLTTSHFKVSPNRVLKQKGIPTKQRQRHTLLIKNMSIMRHLFRVKGKPNILWMRTGERRKAMQGNGRGESKVIGTKDMDVIRPFKDISIAQMQNERVQEIGSNAMLETYEKRIEHEMKRVIAQATKGK